MSQPEREVQRRDVVDTDGVRAQLESISAPDAAGESRALLLAEDGATYVVPQNALVELKSGGYFLSLSLRDLPPRSMPSPNAPAIVGNERAGIAVNAQADEELLVIPVVEEELRVGKQSVERGRVRITKTISEREEIIDEPLQMEEPVVERVPINRHVEVAPPVRYEGDVMIVPLVEEVIVVERRLMLREELRISKRRVETHQPQRVVLRREEAIVERITPDGFEQGDAARTTGTSTANPAHGKSID